MGSDAVIAELSIAVFSVAIVERDDSPEPCEPAGVQIQPGFSHANVCIAMIEYGINVCAGHGDAARPADQIAQPDSRVPPAPAPHGCEPRIDQKIEGGPRLNRRPSPESEFEGELPRALRGRVAPQREREPTRTV